MKVCVVIPTYNESAAIGGIIQAIRKQNLDVIVIDDGSTDTTAHISQSYGAVVLKNAKNRGKGLSLIRGLRYALENNFDAAITLDGDGQHLPQEIPSFIQKAQACDVGIVIGNRIHNPRKMPLVRIITNKFMSWLISRIIRQKVPDTQCGFRLIKKELIKKIQFTTHRFETETEILIQASLLGYKIKSIPIKSIYHREKSRINPVFDTIRFINFIFRQKWIMKF